MVCTGAANCPFTAASLMSALGGVAGLAVSLHSRGPVFQPAYFLVAPVAMWGYVYSRQDPYGWNGIAAHAAVGAAGALIGGVIYGMDRAVLVPSFVGAASGFGVFGVLVLLLLA